MGFISPVPVLNLGTESISGGAINPIPVLRIGTEGATEVAGWIGPIPVLNMGSGGDIEVPVRVGRPSQGYGELATVRIPKEVLERNHGEKDIIDIIQIILMTGILE